MSYEAKKQLVKGDQNGLARFYNNFWDYLSR